MLDTPCNVRYKASYFVFPQKHNDLHFLWKHGIGLHTLRESAPGYLIGVQLCLHDLKMPETHNTKINLTVRKFVHKQSYITLSFVLCRFCKELVSITICLVIL